jgi:hypothetical protein
MDCGVMFAKNLALYKFGKVKSTEEMQFAKAGVRGDSDFRRFQSVSLASYPKLLGEVKNQGAKGKP